MKNKLALILCLAGIVSFYGCNDSASTEVEQVNSYDPVFTDQACEPDMLPFCVEENSFICQNNYMVMIPCQFGCDPQTSLCQPDPNQPASDPCRACTQNQYCTPEGQCVDFSTIECTKKEDCYPNENCVAYKCVPDQITPECTKDEDCTGDMVCQGLKCVEVSPQTPIPPECSASYQPTCEGEMRVTCVEGRFNKARCGLDQECSGGQCIEKICQQGEKACRNGKKGVCQADHSWELTACEPGTYCFEGDCIEHGKAPEIVECGTLSATGNDTCSRTGSGSKIVIQGDILALDKTYRGGSVVIEGNHISYVGCTPDTSNATIITCPSAVVSPGLINGHEHITFSNAHPQKWGDERFDHRHDWRKGKNQHTKIPSPQTSVNNGNSVVEIRQIMAGTTSIFASGSAPGLARNLDVKSQTVGNIVALYQTFPLSDSDGVTKESGCNYTYDSSVQSFDEGCPYGPHIAEGINQSALNELRCLSGQGAGSKDIFKSNVAVIHGIGATVDIIRHMAANNLKLIWSPRTNISLYGDTAMAPLYDRLGVTIGLGTDWIYSGSANMLRELACVDYMNQHHYSQYFTDYEIWKMPTYNNALALGVEKYIGHLTKGTLADIVIFKEYANKSLYRAVIDAENKDVVLVIQDGKFFYGDENLMAGKGEKIDVCGVSKRFDLATANAKQGLKFAGDGVLEPKGELSMNDAAAYGMFFCGLPEDEPTCVPQRMRAKDTSAQQTTMYSGDFTAANDADGDGIPDNEDNCPNIFNPIRPMDTDRHQSDTDNDGYGDICDPYPNCKANDKSCVSGSIDDLDGDTIPDDVDNCPTVSNANQADADNDNKGDACDSCPHDANPGNMSCPNNLTVDFSCTTCKSGKGYAATFDQSFGDVEFHAVGNVQNYNSVYGITLTGNPSTNPPTAIHVTGLTGLGTVTIHYISYNPTGGKGILQVISGTNAQEFEHIYNAGDTQPKEKSFEFNDSTLTEFTIRPQMSESSTSGNDYNRIHITEISWTGTH